MEVWKRGVIIGVVVVIVLLYNFGGNITGNIIEDVVDVGNCSDVLIVTLWNSVFDVDDSNLITIKENVVGGVMCEKYVVYKNNSNGEVWILSEEFYDSSWVGVSLRYGDGKRILNETLLLALYMDLDESFLDSYVFANDVDGVATMRENILDEDIINWSVQDESSARAKIGSLFDFDISGSTMRETFDEIDFWDTVSDSWYYFYYDVSVLKNESVSYIEDYRITNYDPTFVVDFVTDIPNFEFEKNSSWNSAFDINDYFNISDEIVVGFSSIGVNNSGGEWINFSFDGDDVSFKPAVNFTGFREFQLRANNSAGADVYSNVFNVTIGIFNNAPNLIKRFNSIAVSRNSGVRIVLDDYFEDPDGDDLTYRASGDEDLNVTFDSGLMTIWLGDNFNYTTNFRIHASDGIEEARSNSIYVYEEGDSAAAALAEELASNGDADLNGSVGGNTTSGDGGNVSGASGDEDDDGGVGVGWVLWIGIGIVVVGIILFGIWFFILRKRSSSISDSREGVPANPPMVPSVGGVSPTKPGPQIAGAPISSRVDNYLKNLNLSKDNVPVSRK